jgi:Tol biopolymer transport system component
MRILRVSASSPGNLPTEVARNATGDNTDPAWSPDGTRIAFSGRPSRAGNWRLMVASATDPNALPVELAINVSGDMTQPSWSPDSKSIVFTNRQNDGHLRLMTVGTASSGSQPVEIAKTRRARPKTKRIRPGHRENRRPPGHIRAVALSIKG